MIDPSGNNLQARRCCAVTQTCLAPDLAGDTLLLPARVEHVAMAYDKVRDRSGNAADSVR